MRTDLDNLIRRALLEQYNPDSTGCPDSQALNYDPNWEETMGFDTNQFGAFVCQYDYGCAQFDEWAIQLHGLAVINQTQLGQAFPDIVPGINDGMEQPSAAEMKDYICNYVCPTDVDINPGEFCPACYAGAAGFDFSLSNLSNQNEGLSMCTCCDNIVDELEGCTDPEATNYNEEAVIDDGSCEFDNSLTGTTTGSTTYTGCNEGCPGGMNPGCPDPTAWYEQLALGVNGYSNPTFPPSGGMSSLEIICQDCAMDGAEGFGNGYGYYPASLNWMLGPNTQYGTNNNGETYVSNPGSFNMCCCCNIDPSCGDDNGGDDPDPVGCPPGDGSDPAFVVTGNNWHNFEVCGQTSGSDCGSGEFGLTMCMGSVMLDATGGGGGTASNQAAYELLGSPSPGQVVSNGEVCLRYGGTSWNSYSNSNLGFYNNDIANLGNSDWVLGDCDCNSCGSGGTTDEPDCTNFAQTIESDALGLDIDAVGLDNVETFCLECGMNAIPAAYSAYEPYCECCPTGTGTTETTRWRCVAQGQCVSGDNPLWPYDNQEECEADTLGVCNQPELCDTPAIGCYVCKADPSDIYPEGVPTYDQGCLEITTDTQVELTIQYGLPTYASLETCENESYCNRGEIVRWRCIAQGDCVSGTNPLWPYDNQEDCEADTLGVCRQVDPPGECENFNTLAPEMQTIVCTSYFNLDNPSDDPNLAYWTENGACCPEQPDPEPETDRGCMDRTATNYGVCCSGDPNCTVEISEPSCCQYDEGPEQERYNCVEGWGAAAGQNYCMVSPDGEYESLAACEAECTSDDGCTSEFLQLSENIQAACCHFVQFGTPPGGFGPTSPGWSDFLNTANPAGTMPCTGVTLECCGEENPIFTPTPLDSPVTPQPDDIDPSRFTDLAEQINRIKKLLK